MNRARSMMYGALVLSLVLLISSTNGQGNGAIRLIRNGATTTAASSGIVQIYYNSAWGNICDDAQFAYSEANVICHQLGYSGVSTYGSVGSNTMYGTDTSSTAIEDVSCSTSSYLALLQCSVTTSYSVDCTLNSNNDAYVSCYATRIWDSPYSGRIRLVDGTYSNYGRLEVYCNSQWGTVCDDSFGSTDATVACRQLGYNNAYSYTGNIAGSSSQPIWLDNVGCSSSSTSCLAYCENCPSSQYHNCAHSEDVALGCDFDSSFAPFTTISTCTFADSLSNTLSSIGAIIAGVVIGSIVICALVIAIPLCICCCLGVGIGSAARGSSRRVAKTTTVTPQVTTAMITTNETVAAQKPYPATGYDNQSPVGGYQPPPYPTHQQYPATGYPVAQDPNVIGGGYPAPQQAPVGYPQQTPPGYPLQDMAGYPPAGYPQQPPPAYPPQ